MASGTIFYCLLVYYSKHVAHAAVLMVIDDDDDDDDGCHGDGSEVSHRCENHVMKCRYS